VEPPKLSGFKFKPRQVNYSLQIKPRYRPLDFSISPLDEYIDNTKAQSLNFESKTHKAQLEDQKPKKHSRMSSKRRKNAKPTNGTKSGKPKKKQRKAQTQNSP
jgi:hypothetical protein